MCRVLGHHAQVVFTMPDHPRLQQGVSVGSVAEAQGALQPVPVPCSQELHPRESGLIGSYVRPLPKHGFQKNTVLVLKSLLNSATINKDPVPYDL